MKSAGYSCTPPPAAVRCVDGERVTELCEGWQMCLGREEVAWECADADAHGDWLETRVPTTAAATLRAHGRGEPVDFDRLDVWFRVRLPDSHARRCVLALDGIATHAEVYLDGRLVQRSESMFLRQALALGAAESSARMLHLRCAALSPALTKRRPRPRWPSRLVAQKNLRFVRTSMLGRMPGFMPEPAPVGPFRPVQWIERGDVEVQSLRLRPQLSEGQGEIRLEASVRLPDGGTLESATLQVGDVEQPAQVQPDGQGGWTLHAHAQLGSVRAWWPHTHGEPALYPACLVLSHAGSTAESTLVECRPVAFRELQLRAEPPGFGFRVNGEAVFARGACWMPLDAVSLQASEADYRRALAQVLDAGMNMLRLPGFGVYETPLFHDLCDELGILVWQDLMFANLDYPADDADFAAAAFAEVDQVLEALADRPSSALLCGNSEAEQQAAMMGLDLESRRQPFFEERLREQVERCGGLAYWPSTPHGGALPFRTRSGTCHYYGVGAYERSLADLASAQVQFTPECLAFAHLPEELGQSTLGAGELFHSPAFRAGVPRDPGASWDFSDTTEHYVERWFGVDGRAQRRTEPELHLEMFRRAPSLAVSAALGVWRRAEDNCQGALLFLLRDVQPGAGWGIVDAGGTPKAAYWAARRACAPRAAWFVDEGLEGLRLWTVNDRPEPWRTRLELRTLRADGQGLLRRERDIEVAPRQSLSLDVEAELGHFFDASRAYRFGRCEHEVIFAKLGEGDEALQACYFAQGGLLPRQAELGLDARATRTGETSFVLRVSSQRVAQSVRVVLAGGGAGLRCSDNYFDVIPGAPRSVTLSADTPEALDGVRARLCPLNAFDSTPVVFA